MPRSELGPWGKLYASLLEDAAHFTDRQFRAYIGLLCLGIRGRGELPKLRPLRAMFGAEEIDFLIEEGRVTVTDDNAVTIVGWDRYQAPVDRTNAERQRRFREREKATYQQVDTPGDNTVTVTALPTSTSTLDIENDEEKNQASDSGPDPLGDHDALDRYHELTGSYPWGRNVGTWLGELQATHGVAHVVAALEVEWNEKRALKGLLGRVAARLERQAYRVEQARAKEPKLVDPVRAAYAQALEESGRYVEPEPETGDPAAGLAAWQALRGKLGASAPGTAVLHSRKNGSGSPATAAPALTVGEGSVSRAGGGDVLPGVKSGERAPSPPETGAAVVHPPNRARSETSRSRASTDEAKTKETG